MKRGAAQKVLEPYAGTRWPFCPERFSRSTGRLLPARGLAVPVDRRDPRARHYHRLAGLQAPQEYGKMVKKKRSGQ